jgi:hypothetical protein
MAFYPSQHIGPAEPPTIHERWLDDNIDTLLHRRDDFAARFILAHTA